MELRLFYYSQCALLWLNVQDTNVEGPDDLIEDGVNKDQMT